jgi:hypothetical protein
LVCFLFAWPGSSTGFVAVVRLLPSCVRAASMHVCKSGWDSRQVAGVPHVGACKALVFAGTHVDCRVPTGTACSAMCLAGAPGHACYRKYVQCVKLCILERLMLMGRSHQCIRHRQAACQ